MLIHIHLPRERATKSSRNEAKKDATPDVTYLWESTSKHVTNFPFNETPEMKVDMPRDATPYDYFKLFYTDEFIQHIVD